MTTEPSTERTRLAHSLVLLLPAILFGLLVSVQWRTQAERNELTVRYNTPLLDAAKTLQNEQNALKVTLAELRAELDRIQTSASTQSEAAKDLQSRIDGLKTVAGLNERSGDGVEIVLDDARGAAAAKDVEKSICHNTDLTDIVNQAWRGGAEAIAINDERIVGSSSIYCVGSTIMVNGTLMSPPFKVLVIGPQNELLATYDDPTQLRDIKQRRDIYGLGFRVSRATGLHLPPYRGALNVRFATPR